MYKLLHIHNTITFVWDTDKFINKNFDNEVLFIGSASHYNLNKLNQLNYPYKIIQNTKKDINSISVYLNKFDGVVFYNLNDTAVQILLMMNSNVKSFLRFFGFELYNLCKSKYLSEKTIAFLSHDQFNEKNRGGLKKYFSYFKKKYFYLSRSLKIIFNKEYSVGMDNQQKIYKKLDAILMVNKYEYDELRGLFYLPKLIEMKFTNHEHEIGEFRVVKEKLNNVIIGNNAGSLNNHIDIINIIKRVESKSNFEFNLFFSYGNEPVYAEKLKKSLTEMKNVKLLVDFYDKEAFESIYEKSAALVINSYRQNALGNIFTAIKVGCKIYLNSRGTTYKWLIAEGFIISEIEELEADLKIENIRLTLEEQQHNIDCFISVLDAYTASDFLNNVISILKSN